MNVEVEFSLEKRVESEGNCLGDKEVKGIDEIVRYHKSEATLHKYLQNIFFSRFTGVSGREELSKCGALDPAMKLSSQS